MLTGDKLNSVEVEGVDFPALYQSYCRTLRERQLMDYDDQMVYAFQILRQYPQILQYFQTRYQFFCVDEAQDTSRIQHAIIRILAGQSPNLFMVGDEDQSIYGFRAAYPQALTEFEQIYPNARVLYLEQNYRSTRQIVTAADQFIQKNHNRHPKHLKATRGSGPDLRQISVYDRQEQYRYLCKLVEHCTMETAVLYRDNDSALPLIDMMDRLGLTYRCRQVESLFFANRVVRDITDIIRFAQDPNNGELFLNIYYKLGAGISRNLAQEAIVQARRKEEDILSWIAKESSASSWTKRQCKALRTHTKNLLKEQADQAVYRIVHFMGYGDFLKERGGDLGKADILEAIGAQEPTAELLLNRLEVLREIVRAGSTDPESLFVLSTIHSSKGLEYDRVVLMDIADGLLPNLLPEPGASTEEREAYEEERRLFYVGMTRAKQELHLVTFRKPGLESTFSRELFSPKVQRSSERKIPLPSKRKKIPQSELTLCTRDYISGTTLLHKTFGPGRLVSRSGDIAIIAFESGEVKKVALSTAIRAGQLKVDR